MASLFMIQLSDQQAQEMLPYVFGFTGQGAQAGNAVYEITAAYPAITKYFGLLMGPVFSFSYSVASIFMGVLTDRVNRKKLLLWTFALASLTQVLSGCLLYTSPSPRDRG